MLIGAKYSIANSVGIARALGTVSFDEVPRASHKSYLTRTIRLFEYVGIFNMHMECVAFAKGVEVVLDHMLKVKDVRSAKSLLNHMLEAKEKPAEPEEWTSVD
jgi:hypothetical protein